MGDLDLAASIERKKKALLQFREVAEIRDNDGERFFVRACEARPEDAPDYMTGIYLAIDDELPNWVADLDDYDAATVRAMQKLLEIVGYEVEVVRD